MAKRNYRPRRVIRRRPYVNKTKKMVTGQGPTLLEQLARGASGVATVAKAVLPIVSAINTEAKYLDVSYSGNLTITTPSITCITALAQGLTDITRIGNSLLAKSINIKYRFNTSDTAQHIQTRIVIFVDKLQGGTAPTLAQLMSDTASILSHHNKNYTDRFVILKDRIFDMNLK